MIPAFAGVDGSKFAVWPSAKTTCTAMSVAEGLEGAVEPAGGALPLVSVMPEGACPPEDDG
jgi:hypothetical protein